MRSWSPNWWSGNPQGPVGHDLCAQPDAGQERTWSYLEGRVMLLPGGNLLDTVRAEFVQTVPGGIGTHRHAGHRRLDGHAADGIGRDTAVKAGEPLGVGLEPIREGLRKGSLRVRMWRQSPHRPPLVSLTRPTPRNTGRCIFGGFRPAGHLMRSSPPAVHDGCLRGLSENPGRSSRCRSEGGRDATSRRSKYPVHRLRRTTFHARQCRFKKSRFEVSGVHLYSWRTFPHPFGLVVLGR